MKVFIDEIPDGKSVDDYPKDTEFVHRENFHRYDREALCRGEIKLVHFGEIGYEGAATKDEIDNMIKNGTVS